VEAAGGGGEEWKLLVGAEEIIEEGGDQALPAAAWRLPLDSEDYPLS